jgi:hypothetical protein
LDQIEDHPLCGLHSGRRTSVRGFWPAFSAIRELGNSVVFGEKSAISLVNFNEIGPNCSEQKKCPPTGSPIHVDGLCSLRRTWARPSPCGHNSSNGHLKTAQSCVSYASFDASYLAWPNFSGDRNVCRFVGNLSGPASRTGGIVMGIGLSLNGLFWLAAAAMA